MIICTACGRPNEDDDDFCADCGRYLSWVGEHVDAPDAEPEPEPEPEPEAPTVLSRWQRVAHALHLGGKGHSSTTDEPGQPVAPLEAVVLHENRSQVMVAAAVAETHADLGGELPTTPVAAVAGDGAASVARVRGAEHTVGSLDGSLALEGEPASRVREAPALRRPTEIGSARPRRARRPAAGTDGYPGSAVRRPGDIDCLVCRQFNPPTRHFCRRCGTELVVDDVVTTVAYAPLTFWHRHVRRDVRITTAGGRPGRWGRAASGGGGSGRGMRVMARVGAAVIAAAILLSYLGPVAQPLRDWYRHLYRSVINKVDVQYQQQFAIGAQATSATPGHAPSLAVDDADNTYWMSLPSKKTNGAGQSITVVFGTPTRIDRIGVLSGASSSQQAFLSEARPDAIDITYNKSTIHETLQDSKDFQRLATKIPGVLSITFTVRSVYTSVTGHRVAITELEFFTRT